MRAHCFQHVPFEGLGSIQAWLEATGYDITVTRFYERPELPVAQEVDFLVVMGGPMSVNDQEAYPWLVAEKSFIRDVIEAGKPVLGICLGAQLIASAMGGVVRPNPVKEIGWFPVEGVKPDPLLARGGSFRFPSVVQAFHWHGETFELPSRAIRLARSEACENQAFQLGRSVIGLQFHLETTPESARQLVAHCGDELVDGPYIQPREEILSVSAATYEVIHWMMEQVLVYLHESRPGPSKM